MNLAPLWQTKGGSQGLQRNGSIVGPKHHWSQMQLVQIYRRSFSGHTSMLSAVLPSLLLAQLWWLSLQCMKPQILRTKTDPEFTFLLSKYLCVEIKKQSFFHEYFYHVNNAYILHLASYVIRVSLYLMKNGLFRCVRSTNTFIQIF